jgi:hypothetical protein
MTGREGRTDAGETGLAARWHGAHKWVKNSQRRFQCAACGFTKAEAAAWNLVLCPGDGLTNRGYRASKGKLEVVVWVQERRYAS